MSLKKLQFKKIDHLIRYFFIIGIVVFVGYFKHWHESAFLCLIGPSIYVSSALKSGISNFISLPSTNPVNMFGFLLPVTLAYFMLIGFQLKKLWNERGIIRPISLFALIGFLGYVHLKAWSSLSAYFVAL